MKSWYDLKKGERNFLKNEFNNKKKVIDLRIIFYLLAIISFIPLFIVIFAKINNECYENTCEMNMLKYGLIFLIFLSSGIINSILLDTKEKEFKKWLQTKNIVK